MLRTGVFDKPRIMVHVVAYNAGTTLARTLDRIPPEVRPQLAEVCVFDDASSDDTFEVGQDYKAETSDEWPVPLHVFRNPRNRGYGGNQKIGYRYAIERGYDVVVLLHGDGQYAPEEMARLIQPILDGEADAVFGSRMMNKRNALKGGMPLYKYISNRFLTLVQNLLLGYKLSEYHTGFRAFRREVLETLPLESNSDDFVFDNEMLAQAIYFEFRLGEISSPTRYFPEASSINFSRSLKYGVSRHALIL